MGERREDNKVVSTFFPNKTNVFISMEMECVLLDILCEIDLQSFHPLKMNKAYVFTNKKREHKKKARDARHFSK